AHGHPDRGPARGVRRHLPRPGARPHRPCGAARRARVPLVLARRDADPPLRAPSRPPVPGRRLRQRLRRPPALDVPAGSHRCAGDDPDPHPQPAREPARGVRVGLRHDGASEGHPRAARARAPRPSQRDHLDRLGARRERRLPDRRHADRRAGLRAARRRPADDQRDQRARLPGRAGGDAGLRRGRRPRLPADGRDLRPPRPAREVRLVAVAAEAVVEAQVVEHRRGFARRWYRTPSFVAGISILGFIVLLAVFAPFLSSHGPTQQNLLETLQNPSWSHPLGTDDLGRDVWSRILYGARTDLHIAFLAVLFPFCIGTLLGLVAGYYGGWFDGLL